MPNELDDAMNKALHPQAAQLTSEYVTSFATSLLLHAKTLAFQRRADVVLSSHVEEARDLLDKQTRQSWARELVIILGAAFFGAFIQGFIVELSAGRTSLVAVYTALGFVGMLMIFWGLRL